MIIINCTAVEGIPQMLRHGYMENYQDIPFSGIARKLNACALQCVPGVPPCPSSKLELETPGYEASTDANQLQASTVTPGP